MKTHLRSFLALALMAGTVATVQVGCTSSATGKSTGEYIDDAAITTRVKAAFVRDPVVKALEVGVDTFKGTVNLSGFVDNQEQKTQAERIAAATPGVVSVKNNLVLKTSTSSSTTNP